MVVVKSFDSVAVKYTVNAEGGRNTLIMKWINGCETHTIFRMFDDKRNYKKVNGNRPNAVMSKSVLVNCFQETSRKFCQLKYNAPLAL